MVQSLRINYNMVEHFWFVIHAKGKVPKPLWDKLFQQLKDRYQRIYHKTLPQHIPMPYIAQTDMLGKVQASFIKTMENIKIPNILRMWIKRFCTWIPIKGKRIIDLLHTP